MMHLQLPLRLYLSGPSPVVYQEEPYLARWLYQIALREASRPEDLTSYLDWDTLIALWPELHLQKGVRQAGRSATRSWGPPRPGRPNAGQ